jgi:hypothetical protein
LVMCGKSLRQVEIGGVEVSLKTEFVLINPKKYLLILLKIWIPKLCQLPPRQKRLSSTRPLQFCDWTNAMNPAMLFLIHSRASLAMVVSMPQSRGGTLRKCDCGIRTGLALARAQKFQFTSTHEIDETMMLGHLDGCESLPDWN